MAKMIAGQALVKVLESWDVDHVYGIPGGSINHTVEGLYLEQDKVKYIQVRHEEVGAMAASADAKLTGKIGVAFGSAGPGATHLFNGLYDAKMDHVPVLALVGQVGQDIMNTNYFQEMDEGPMFADVAVYNRTVTTADQIPYVINQAIREAYRLKGVAVVTIPENLSAEEIDFSLPKTPATVSASFTETIDPEVVKDTVKLIQEANHPLFYVGTGLKGARKELDAVSEQFDIPVVSTVPATGIMETNHPNYLGTNGRLGSKSGYEAVQEADLIIFIGSEYPFARFWPKDVKIIQVNDNSFDIGKVVPVDYTVISDGKTYLQALMDSGATATNKAWISANRKNRENWLNWLDVRAQDESTGLQPEAVMKQVRALAGPNDTYGVDTGNVSEFAVRGVKMDENQKFVLSGLFATMGYGLPAGLAGALSFPDSQAWTFSGDGGIAMVIQDLLTEVRYELPVVNIVFSNERFGFIWYEQQQTKQHFYGVDLTETDWAKVADGFGAIGFNVSTLADLETTFKEIKRLQEAGNKKPILLNAQIDPSDPIATGFMPLDPDKYSQTQIDDYAKQYKINTKDQPALGTLLKEAEH
ncbi:pyruvate oxidase [Furfurilactobacillus entadae]|uniref:pyruvate oxidase n=1 Tax=Furfurilactobacillus entadae TaxID=2922307 RepID=UPI0035E4D368